jgi:hypothetical protein
VPAAPPGGSSSGGGNGGGSGRSSCRGSPWRQLLHTLVLVAVVACALLLLLQQWGRNLYCGLCVARWLESQGYYRVMSACARGWARVSEMLLSVLEYIRISLNILSIFKYTELNYIEISLDIIEYHY